MVFMRAPMPSISVTTTSPGWQSTTPSGVPVRIRSPGLRVMKLEKYSIRKGTSKIMSLVWPCCVTLPLTVVFNASSIWFQNEQGFVNIEYFDATHNALYNITLHVMDEAFRLVRLVEVPRATWTGTEWELAQGSVTAFINEGDSVTRNTIAGDLRVDAKPDELRRKRRRAYEFSYNELRKQIGELERKGLDATEYLVDLNYKLAAPFAQLDQGQAVVADERSELRIMGKSALRSHERKVPLVSRRC